jgi:hypothetical protein
MIPDAVHSFSEKGMIDAIVEATDSKTSELAYKLN